MLGFFFAPPARARPALPAGVRAFYQEVTRVQLVFWDRLFGAFQAEEEPVHGLASQGMSWAPRLSTPPCLPAA